MANVSITNLPAALPLDGTELVPVVQNGVTVRTTTSAVAGSPAQQQTFLTLNQEPTLPNSRALSASTGLTLTDGGALSALTVGMNGAAASLNAAGNGFAVKTGLGTVTPRNIAVSGSGIAISNGSGLSGNPTVSLNGLPLALANASGAGIVALSGSGTLSPRIITGTANQIAVANGSGASADPVISLASNPIVPGNASLTMPAGTTAERPVGVDGMVRYNTDSAVFEGYLNGSWNAFASGSGVTSIATGNGLTGGPITSTGTISIDTSVVATLTDTQTLTNKTLTSPVLTTPALGTPASGVMTNVTGLPLATGVTGTLPILNGGTGATNATTARSNLSAAKSGVNTDITSVALTTGTISGVPTASTDIVNKTYVDSTAQGLNFHQACEYTSTGTNFIVTYNNGASGVGATLTNAGSLSAFTIDGYTFVSPGDIGKRVLIMDQPFGYENGIYTVTTVGSGSVPWVLTRATDFNTAGTGANQIDAGDFVYIINGTFYANTSWVQQTPLPIVIGVTPIVFIQFGAATGGVSSFSAGTTGLTPNTATTGNVTLDGTLAIANGGTGAITAPNALTNLAAAGTSISNTFTANQIVSVTDNTNAALRITQLGSGNALLVEDSTNPDASPFVIDSSGKVIAGYTTPITTSGSFSPLIQSVAAGQTAGFGTSAWLNSTAGGNVIFAKSRSGTIGTFGIVNSGDDLGSVRFDGDDGTQFVRAAQITSQVDGTPNTNDMPGRLIFSTTADGASSPTERMRIDSAGNVGIGGTAGTDTKFQLLGTYPTSGTNTFVQQLSGTSPSGTTNVLSGYRARLNTQAAAFALSNLRIFDSGQGTIGATSSVTNQYGYWADASLTGATNNYGFYGNIAAPTAGITTTGTISTISSSGTTVTVSHNAITYTNGQTVTIAATANATALVSGATATILTVGTTDYTLIGAASNTVGVSFTASGAGTGTGTVTLNVQGSGKTVAGAASGSFTYTTTTSQTFAAVTVLTGTVTVSARYNLYMSGTADNYFAGDVLQGHTSTLSFSAPAGTVTPTIQSIAPTSSLTQGVASVTNVTSANGPNFIFGKSRGASASSPTIVSSGDLSGNISFTAYDGAAYLPTAYIQSAVDGTPGLNDMPGRLTFSTTADGAIAPTERMRIANTGAIGLSGANYGTAGQVLTSAGSGASPTWSGISGGTF